MNTDCTLVVRDGEQETEIAARAVFVDANGAGPRLSPPEVSRISRMGQLPKHLLEVICNNGGWLQIPEVRRALLSNPRLTTDQILRVLRHLPKPELKVTSTQAVYPHAVRDAAR